jgi:hypothetical protein
LPSVFPFGATDARAGNMGKDGRDQYNRLTFYFTGKSHGGQGQKAQTPQGSIRYHHQYEKDIRPD